MEGQLLKNSISGKGQVGLVQIVIPNWRSGARSWTWALIAFSHFPSSKPPREAGRDGL